MNHDQLPDHWTRWVEERTADRKHPGRLGLADFQRAPGVRLRFADGSTAHFHHAFAVEDEARRELAVFTEHCGYHVFPLGDLEVSSSDESGEPREP